MTNYRSVLLAALVFTTAPVWARQGKFPPPPGTAPGKPVKVAPRPPQDINQKRVTITLKNATAEEALTQLLDLSGYGYEFDGRFYSDTLTAPVVNGKLAEPSVILDLPPRRVTMKIVNAPFPKALNSVCQVLGVSWTMSTGSSAEDVPSITIVRTGATVTRADLMRTQVVFAGGSGGLGGSGRGGFGGSKPAKDDRLRLLDPETPRLSVDVKDTPARTALAAALKGAGAEYVFDEDVAQAGNITLSFKNVSLRTALDALCESAGLGWITEDANNPKNPTARLIRIGKRYAPKTP